MIWWINALNDCDSVYFFLFIGAGKDYDEDDLYEAMLDSDEFDEDSSDDEWIIEDEG